MIPMAVMEVSFGPVGNIIGLIIVLLVAGVVMFFVMRKMLPGVFATLKERPRGPRLAELEVESKVPFELSYTTQHAKEHRLFLAYRVQLIEGTGTSSNVGMIVSIDCHVDGEQVLHEKLGKGYSLQKAVDRMVTVDYYCTSSAVGSRYTRKATMLLTRLAPRPAGAAIVVKGVVEPNRFTDASKLTLFIC